MTLPSVRIGGLELQVPVIQGGMGVGISLSSLAGAVAREGGMGVLSAAQPGYRDPEWTRSPLESNLRALGRHIRRARELSQGRGLLGVNIMRACTDYEKYVRCAAENGADAILSGAGLPTELPGLIEGTELRFAPIVSSLKAIRVLFSLWKRHYGRVSDFVVIEGPKAGGHLGFTAEQARTLTRAEYDLEIGAILRYVSEEAAAAGTEIPVFVAGGIYDRSDIDHYLRMGASGVQMATRFVATEECDAPRSYKEAYVRAAREDVVIVKSPVGMPGRAIRNRFVWERESSREPVQRCFRCLERCNPATTPYCITMALCRAAGLRLGGTDSVSEPERGETEREAACMEDALLFCGENVWRIDRISTVAEIFSELNRDI